MADTERPEINMARIKVAGIGGLGMVAMVAVLAYNMPAVRTFVLLSLAGGMVIALGVIAYRRWLHVEPPHGPTLMVDQSSATDEATRVTTEVDRPVKLATIA